MLPTRDALGSTMAKLTPVSRLFPRPAAARIRNSRTLSSRHRAGHDLLRPICGSDGARAHNASPSQRQSGSRRSSGELLLTIRRGTSQQARAADASVELVRLVEARSELWNGRTVSARLDRDWTPGWVREADSCRSLPLAEHPQRRGRWTSLLLLARTSRRLNRPERARRCFRSQREAGTIPVHRVTSASVESGSARRWWS